MAHSVLKTSAWPGVGTAIAGVMLFVPSLFLRTYEPHATIDRLFKSQHVKDLRLIAGLAFFIFYVALWLILSELIYDCVSNRCIPKGDGISLTMSGLFALETTINCVDRFTPQQHDLIVLLFSVVALVAAAVSWAYQTGSARLGVVDLFAREISTLCTVAAVNDTINRHVEQFRHGPNPETLITTHDAAGRPFTSQESYFPVFENNAGDLETLEARVVEDITAFYTYMKAARDSMRVLAVTKPIPSDLLPSSQEEAAPSGSWREAARNVIYMLYLGLENGRHAVSQLVEFEPEQDEVIAIILLNELVAYCFLMNQFPDPGNLYHARIAKRKAEYLELAPVVYRDIEREYKRSEQALFASKRAKLARHWGPAYALLPQLAERYKAATGRSITQQTNLAVRHPGPGPTIKSSVASRP